MADDLSRQMGFWAGVGAALLVATLGLPRGAEAALAGEPDDAAPGRPPDNATEPAPAADAALVPGTALAVLVPGAGPLDGSRGAAARGPLQMAQATPAGQGEAEEPGGTPQTVGQAPEKDDIRPDQLAALNVGGVLTPQGMLVVEPSYTYSHTATNRFTFRGTEIVETVLIGIVEAEDSDRDFMEGALTLRYGLTDRIEIETRLPYVYRNDDVRTSANIGGTDVKVTDSLDGSGIGDVEFAGHYQINQGGGGIPYFVANLRGKLDTGTSPYDVDRDASGIETELPTGSGFYSVEPSLTVIYPSDPVVLFGTVGYLWNIKRDIDKTIGGVRIGEVDPGDSIRLGFGFSFAVNENMSFSLSYSQDLIRKTETEVNGVNTKSEDLTVGQVTFGISHRINDWMSIDLGTTFGVTGDATDVSVGVRLPMRFQLF